MENDFKVDASVYYPSSLLGEEKKEPNKNVGENKGVQENFSGQNTSLQNASPLSSMLNNLLGGGGGIGNLLSSLSNGGGAGMLSLLKNLTNQKDEGGKTNALTSLFAKKTNDDKEEFKSQGKIESFKKVFENKL